jgi:hypothetical protein
MFPNVAVLLQKHKVVNVRLLRRVTPLTSPWHRNTNSGRRSREGSFISNGDSTTRYFIVPIFFMGFISQMFIEQKEGIFFPQ